MKPRVLLALFFTFNMCVFQFSVSVMVIPKYAWWSITSRAWFQHGVLMSNGKPLILYRDTKLMSIHMDLPSFSRGGYPVLNSTCDPDLSKFYDRVLSSIRTVQRAINRLISVHGVTDLLECDSYLRRFYGLFYVSGLLRNA